MIAWWIFPVAVTLIAAFLVGSAVIDQRRYAEALTVVICFLGGLTIAAAWLFAFALKVVS